MVSLRRDPEPRPAHETTLVTFRYDRPLLALTFILMGVGLVMIYSASIVTAEFRHADAAYFLKRQAVFTILALAVLAFCMNLHHDLWRRIPKVISGSAAVLLLLILVPALAVKVNGATRWLDVGGLRFQPGEIVKVAWVMVLAGFLSAKQDKLTSLREGWRTPLIIFGVLVALLLLQPDFGTSFICAALLILMYFSAGARWRDVGILVALGAGLVAAAIYAAPYRMRRMTAFLNPEADPLDAGYQVNQALISFGSGQWTGLGLGESRQKLAYLPEAHTDFIFSILGEELGFMGVALVILLFVAFIWRGFLIARRSTSAFGALLAFGITASIGMQAMINMGVATAMLPNKGVTLPFISYGGSSLVLVAAATGILLNISRRSPPPTWLHRFLPDENEQKRRARNRRRRRPVEGHI